MVELKDLLKSFNRKERYWLLKDAIGEPFFLSEEFRTKLGEEIRQEIPADAWWAMDYHIDWLIAVLRIFPSQPDFGKSHPNTNGEIKRNQEDIDLIITFKNKTTSQHQLILIEAKTKYFGNGQLKSKLSRLNALLKPNGETISGIKVSFVLSSPPHEMRTLNSEKYFPTWALKNDTPFHIDLPIFENALMVSRSDEGNRWGIHKFGPS